jgi:uncharacterized membrane protein YoaK (UPF0700 family)
VTAESSQPVKAKDARSGAATGEGALQAFVAGYVDTCGFIALFGLFTAHVTGNLVLIGAAIVEHRGGLLGKLIALPVFILAVAASRWLNLVLESRGRNSAVPLLGIQILFLAGFLGVGVAASPISDFDAPLAVLAGMLGVTAMAVQNTASRTLYSMYTPTTVMTGNVTQVVIDLVDLALGRGTPEAKGRVRKMLPAILAFTAGALLSAVAFTLTGFWCLLVPIAVVILLFVREFGRKN